ncbi:MAG: hypothetical protein Q8M53_05985 [Burkholderiales bacterium]|nr:hypothetical protein [Burkholderiales bacterium]
MKLTGNLPNAEYRRFESFREYEDIVGLMIPLTQRIIRVFDRNPAPAWNTSTRIGLLRQFLLAHRSNRLLIVLHETRSLTSGFPRLLELSRQFSHACVIRETLRSAKHASDPFVIFDASHYVHRFHFDHMRAAEGRNDAAGAQQLIERFGEIEEASGPPLAAHVTGL